MVTMHSKKLFGSKGSSPKKKVIEKSKQGLSSRVESKMPIQGVKKAKQRPVKLSHEKNPSLGKERVSVPAGKPGSASLSVRSAKVESMQKRTVNQKGGHMQAKEPVQNKMHQKHGKDSLPAASSTAALGIRAGIRSEVSSRLKQGLRGVSSEMVCREVACEALATTASYCRLHYIKNWKKLKKKELILRERKLNQYIEELVSKYPDRYVEAIRQDLASDQDFAKVISDLDLEESHEDFESESSEAMDGIIDHIKREFDDDGDLY